MGKFQVKFAQRHEREVAAVWPGAFQTPSSGNKMEKADVQTTEVDGLAFMIECKATQNSSYMISKTVWNTVKSHAQNKSYALRPVLAVRLYGQTNQDEAWGIREHSPETLPVELDLLVIENHDFLELLDELLELRAKVNVNNR